MDLDDWREERAAEPCESLPHATSTLQGASGGSAWQTVDVDRPAGCTSECRRVLQAQIKAAAATGAFVFAHRRLDGITAVALAQYLRDECRARFVDLSSLDRWSECSLAIAAALKHGLRPARSLALDGNAIGACPEVLEAWCSAVRDHPGLQCLSLRGTGLDDAGAVRLARALRGNPVLFSLDIGRNHVGDAGVNALAETLGGGNVIIEIGVEGTDASHAAREDLATALERNRRRFGGSSGGSAVLHGLQRARATALASVSQFAASAPPLETQSAAAHEERDFAASMFFEASNGHITDELTARCEAGWHYNTADQTLLTELRARIGDLKIEGRLEHHQAEETLARVAETQGSFAKKHRPMEDRIIRLKEELSAEIEATRQVLQSQIQNKLALKAAEEEVEEARQDLFRYKLGAAHLEHILKARNREVAEEAQALERRARLAEEETEAVEADNERCRRTLHAMRFETERERFVPAGVAA